MKKKQRRNLSLEITPGPGVFYSQKKCNLCQKLIVASNSKSYEAASCDLGRKLKKHRQECQKQDKQLNLPLYEPEGNEVEPVTRITLRGKAV